MSSKTRMRVSHAQVYLVDRGSVRLLENGVDDYVKEIKKKLKAAARQA
jgi:hypothetical protein